MKAGRTLTEIAQELERQVKSKKDYLADTKALAMEEHKCGALQLRVNGGVGITELCHDQIATRLGIPQKYYDLMRSQAPTLLTQNVNHWFASKSEKRLIRTLDGNARAFLSDRYRPLDNYDLAEVVLPKLQQMKCRIESAEITERRMYIKAVTDRITGEIKKGDVVQAGLVVSNSEVGCGSIKVEPMIYRLVCLNGMIQADASLRKYHVGRGHDDLEDVAKEYFRDATRRADDRAFWMKVRDVVDGSLDQVRFHALVEKMKNATKQEIDGNPIKAIEVVSRRLGWTDEERGSVIKHLIKEGDLSQYGLINAVTRASQDIADYDRATEFERFGGEILELPKTDWAAIASAN